MTELAAAFAEHLEVVAASAALVPVLDEVAALIERSLLAGGKVLVLGNGGSAADAQHFASELVGRLVEERAGWPAIALTVDSSALTAIANDDGFERVFARQVDALADAGDVVVALSVSGTSPNVVAAASAARDRGCVVVALTGQHPSGLGAHADVVVSVPSPTVARVQEVHGLCLHAVASRLEATLPATRPRS